MYTIHIDGALLFSTGLDDDKHIILSPKLDLDVNGSGSLTFVMPPGHALYDGIRKMKSIITVHHDDTLLFRGRVLEDERDFFNQKNVYCEGDLSFLLDSLYEEQTVTGKASDFFSLLIENHNEQVDDDKQFTVGIVTATDEEMPDTDSLQAGTREFRDTSTVINERLTGVYGGYLRTRTEGDVRKIDWIKDFEEESAQPIQFSVNMLDLKDKVDAGDVFTCLIPLGYSEIKSDGSYSDPVNIKDVNNGVEYIFDQDAVNKYGKIWRTKTWGNTKNPAKLLEKAQEYLKTGAELQTLTLTAVDMHFADGNAEMIRIGTKVRIVSDPHGIDMQKVCCKMAIDLLNPENTTYTFGERPRTLSEAVIRTEKETSNLSGGSGGGGGGGRKSIQEEVSEILRWAKIQVNEANSNINLNAGKIDKTNQYMAAAGINIDGDIGSVKIMATKESVNDLDDRIEKAEASIEVNADGISSKVSKNGVISAINQSAESVTIKASKIDLDGFVTADTLAAQLAALENASFEQMYGGKFSCGSLTINGTPISFESIEVVTSVSLSKSYADVMHKDGYPQVVLAGATLSAGKKEIFYLDWE